MSYQVLARKWRPQSFAELVGQTHVLQALVNALDQDRLHHAYLFTGTRGVGKTTIARIFAKCLNCDNGVSSTPCGECSSCQAINDGRFVDLIEVDAASRTKVEDTRELLENVQYAPTHGRYKVYLIDEVHMLSTHSFNALLKTLEEPPPHVKFLLATTDPQKLPVTILSRCLQFSLKSISPERVAGHLKHVLGEEAIPFEAPALWQLAIAADGSMRDALSLTDQAIAFGEGRVKAADVSAMLGTLDKDQVMRVVNALVSANATDVLQAVSELADHSPDYLAVLDDMLAILHRIAVAQAVPEAVDNSLGDREQVVALAQRVRAEDVQLYYQVGLVGKKDLPLAPSPRSGFEMALLRMLAFRPEALPVPQGQVLKVSREHDANNEQVVSEPESSAEPEPEPAPPAAPEPEPAAIQELPSQEHTPPHMMEGLPPLSAYDDVSAPQSESVDRVESIPENGPSSAVKPTPLSFIGDSPAAVVPLSDVVLKGDSRLPLEKLDPSGWIAVYRGLSLGGVTGTLTSHCEYHSHEGDLVRLRLDSKRSTLYNDTHRMRIAEKLTDYFGQPVRVDITIGDIKTETPAQWCARKAAERLAQAKTSVYSDPFVKMLIQDFSATVLDDSIAPVGESV
ncbi:DNA polymerase III subunit gamma/tau [Candidatus Sororendozoicomonas aggregata]|uniref:DNA polymerase III subunit gamma/tau n=1 Tax=Candidatus Sororendozoicomonas aggregata TaxID=3073239 RepID=UPI002ED2C290